MAIERITKEDLKSKLDAGEDIQVLDVRNPVDYGTSDVKIGAAVRIPVGELEFRYTELDREKEVIAYCTWTNEHSSARAAQILLEKGFSRAKALLGGFTEWIEAGYKVENK